MVVSLNNAHLSNVWSRSLPVNELHHREIKIIKKLTKIWLVINYFGKPKGK